MKQVKTLILTLIVLCYFSACQQKMICPAYHSYFILDVDETRNTFSLFGADSLPKKKWDVDKEKWGIAKEVSDQKKLRDMRIISMNSIYKKIEDPFAEFQRTYAESDSMMYVDSAAVLSASRGDNDFQNIDQMIYLHHFGKYLPAKNNHMTVDDQLRRDLREEEDEPMIQDEEPPARKKKKGFLGFGKKKRKKNQEAATEQKEEQQEDQ